MSSPQADLPLDPNAVSKTNDQFYAGHPEMVQDGNRVPLDANDPSQAQMRSEWSNLYSANSGQTAPKPTTARKPGDTAATCPGNLVVKVVDKNGKPIPKATVKADSLVGTTDENGQVRFDSIPAKEYGISATKGKANRIDTYPNTATVRPKATTSATLGLTCILYKLEKPKLIAQGSEALTGTATPFSIPGSVGGPLTLNFGQDLTFGTGGKLAAGWEVGSNEAILKKEMDGLLTLFAWNDPDGKARREFSAFQSKKSSVELYEDGDLNKDAAASDNFKDYPKRALAAPGMASPPAGKTRIHQALAAAGWNINAVTSITDLGVPAFNSGDMPGVFSNSSGDRANGLFAMVDAVTHILVFADQYEYDSCKQEYTIHLVFELYDSFGLDDEDVRSYGYGTHLTTYNKAGEAISAWWQLQHQFNYAPMITKITINAGPFTVPAK